MLEFNNQTPSLTAQSLIKFCDTKPIVFNEN